MAEIDRATIKLEVDNSDAQRKIEETKKKGEEIGNKIVQNVQDDFGKHLDQTLFDPNVKAAKDAEELRLGIEAVGKEYEKTGTIAEDAMDGILEENTKTKHSLLEIAGVLSKIVAGTAAIVVGADKLGNALADALKSAEDRANDFSIKLAELGGAGADQVATLTAETAELRAAFDRLNNPTTAFGPIIELTKQLVMNGRSASGVTEELIRKQQALADAVLAQSKKVDAEQKAAADKKAEEESKARDARIQAEVTAADAAVRASISKTLEGEDKILAERNANIMRLKDAREKAETDYAKSAYDTAIEFEKKAATAAVAEYRKGLEEKKAEAEKAAREDEARFEKLAQAQADAISRAFTRINREAQAATNLDRFQVMGDQIIDLLNAIERRRGD